MIKDEAWSVSGGTNPLLYLFVERRILHVDVTTIHAEEIHPKNENLLIYRITSCISPDLQRRMYIVQQHVLMCIHGKKRYASLVYKHYENGVILRAKIIP